MVRGLRKAMWYLERLIAGRKKCQEGLRHRPVSRLSELVAGRYCEKHQKQEYSNYNNTDEKRLQRNVTKNGKNCEIILLHYTQRCLNGDGTLLPKKFTTLSLWRRRDNSMENLMSLVNTIILESLDGRYEETQK